MTIEKNWRVVEWDTPFPSVWEVWHGDQRVGAAHSQEEAERFVKYLNSLTMCVTTP